MRSLALMSLGMFLVVFCAVGASADPIGLSANGSVGVWIDSQIYNASLNPGPSLSPILSVSNSQGSAALSGVVQYGSITGSAYAATTAISSNAAVAQFTGTWQDTLSITSNTLPHGTLVTLLFTLAFDSNSVCTGSHSAIGEYVSFSAAGTGVSAQNNKCGKAFQGVKQFDVAAPVGYTMDLQGELNIEASVSPGNNSAWVDPPVGFYVDSLTPDAFYTTGSGASYFSPTSVPEPASILLIGSGLLGVISRVHKGHRS